MRVCRSADKNTPYGARETRIDVFYFMATAFVEYLGREYRQMTWIKKSWKLEYVVDVIMYAIEGFFFFYKNTF